MPWEPKDATRHTHKAKTAKKKRQWSDVADSALKRGESEGSAIRMANAVVAGTAHHRGRRREGSRIETRQEGGPVEAGKKYLVGEKGKEMFAPSGELGKQVQQEAEFAKRRPHSAEAERRSQDIRDYGVPWIPKQSMNQKEYPARQAGGPVEKDKAYTVGEKGPEIFKPDQDGKIIPHHKLKKRRMGAKGGMRAPLGRGAEELRTSG